VRYIGTHPEFKIRVWMTSDSISVANDLVDRIVAARYRGERLVAILPVDQFPSSAGPKHQTGRDLP